MCDVIAQSTQNILWQDKSVAVRWINDEINTSRHFVKHSDRRNVSAAVVHRSVIDQSEWFCSWYNYFLFPRSFLLWFLSINFSFYHILSSFHHFVSSSIAGICHLLVFCSWTSRLALSSHFVLGHISVDCPDWFGHVSVCECVWQHVCVCVCECVYQLFPWQPRNVLEQTAGEVELHTSVSEQRNQIYSSYHQSRPGTPGPTWKGLE